MSTSIQYQPVSEILDGLRAQLADRSHDDIHLLVKIYTGLKNLDTDHLSPYDASHWLIQPQTKKEKRLEDFVTQIGFDRGLICGFLIGFGVCALVALAMRYH